MYTLEYIKSKSRASEHMYHKDIIDYYLLLKDNKRIFSEEQDWLDYCLALEIDNLNKEILIKKIFCFIASNPMASCYNARTSDYCTIQDDLFAYIEEVKDMLDILDYKIRV
jgi:hypothetical protein